MNLVVAVFGLTSTCIFHQFLEIQLPLQKRETCDTGEIHLDDETQGLLNSIIGYLNLARNPLSKANLLSVLARNLSIIYVHCPNFLCIRQKLCDNFLVFNMLSCVIQQRFG